MWWAKVEKVRGGILSSRWMQANLLNTHHSVVLLTLQRHHCSRWEMQQEDSCCKQTEKGKEGKKKKRKKRAKRRKEEKEKRGKKALVL
jgi:hypothetical protein